MRYHVLETPTRLCLDIDGIPKEFKDRWDAGKEGKSWKPAEYFFRAEWRRRFNYLKRAGLVTRAQWFKSNTPSHWHVIVYIDTKLPETVTHNLRCWIHLFLFSDPWRSVGGFFQQSIGQKFAVYIVRSKPYPSIKTDFVCKCPWLVCKSCGHTSDEKFHSLDDATCKTKKNGELWEPQKLGKCACIVAKHSSTGALSFSGYANQFRKFMCSSAQGKSN